MAGGVYGYSGWAKVDDTTVMVMPGGRIDRPRNIVPGPVNNNPYGPTCYSEGVRFPQVDLPLAVHASWFTAANLNAWFLTRGADPYDLAALAADLDFGESSLGEHKVNGAKGAGFSLNWRFGQNPLVVNMTFQGTTLAGAGGPPTPLTTSPLTFAAVSFTGGLANKDIIGVQLNYNGALTPNESLLGVQNPGEHNADFPTGTLGILQYAKSGVLPPGYTDPDTYTEVAGGAMRVQIGAGPAVYTTFTFSRLVIQNPNQRETQQGRVIRRFEYQMYATDAAYPLVVSAT